MWWAQLLNNLIATFEAGAAAGGSFESIATVTASGGETSLTFSSIPSTYKHLQIRYNGRKTTSGITDLVLTFNGDTGNNYSKHWLFTFDGGGPYTSTATSNSGFSVGYLYGDDSNVTDSGIIDIHDYSSSSKNTTARYFIGNEKVSTGTTTLLLGSGAWYNTNAVTSITLSCSSIQAGSTFALYGIAG